MDTKRSFNPISEGFLFIYTIVDHFSIHKVTLPTPEKTAYYAVHSLSSPVIKTW